MQNLPDVNSGKPRWCARVTVDGSTRVLAVVFASSEEGARETAERIAKSFPRLKHIYAAWVKAGKPVERA